MKEFYLSNDELAELRLAHREARATNAPAAYKINAVILLGTGWTLKKVKAALLLDDETLRGYVQLYREGGVDLLINTNHKGSECRLTGDELDSLKNELNDHIHLTTDSVIEFVMENFNTLYSKSGMRDLLHRIGFVYKKPKLVPGNPDAEAQAIFVDQYEQYMEQKPNDVEVIFVDAVHPEHNAISAYGWIARGKEKEIKTNSGRERLNFHGALNIETLEITVIESETVNADSTLNLLKTLELKYSHSREIVVILDNAKYHYSKIVKDFIANSKIRLVFLPSYSPNLNIIERLWKFFKKKVLYNTYYKNLEAFRKACTSFFRDINKYHDELTFLLADEFELA